MNNILKQTTKFLTISFMGFYATAFAQIPTFSTILINGDKCLEVDNNNIGTKLRAANCSVDSKKQQFLFSEKFIKTALDPDLCLSAITGSAAPSKTLFLWKCTQNDGKENFVQDFKIVQSKISLDTNDNLCLTFNAENNEIFTDGCDINKNQTIAFLTELKINENCLQLDKTELGTPATAVKCDNSLKQKFFVYQNQIKPMLDLTKCIDSFDSDPKIKNIYLNQCLTDNKFQKFVITQKSIIAEASKECMTLAVNKPKVPNAVELTQCTN